MQNGGSRSSTTRRSPRLPPSGQARSWARVLCATPGKPGGRTRAGFTTQHGPGAAIVFSVDVRPRIDSDLDGCEDVAAVVRAADGYPPHLPHQLRQFVASEDALGAWVADDSGQIVGHVALNPTSSDEVLALACAVLHKPPAALGVVARLFVAPSRRGQGTGGRLLRVATAAALRRGLVPILDVGTHFAPAIALYERNEWTRLGAVTVTFRERNLDEFVYVGPGELVRSANGHPTRDPDAADRGDLRAVGPVPRDSGCG